MFAPNSIKTLINIKNYNQLDQGKDISLKRSLSITNEKTIDDDNEETLERDFSPKNSRDMFEKVVSTKVLIKEIDNKLTDLKKWKQNQRRELEMNLAQNKAMLIPLTDNQATPQKDFYEEYAQKLDSMMDLYKSDLEEARRTAKNQDIGHSKLMNEINNKLLDRESKITELSSQLSIYENQKFTSTQSPDFIGDIQALKSSLDASRKDFSDSIRKTQREKGDIIDKENETNLDPNSFKVFFEKEKKELTKEKRYNFKDDLNDIESELQELEEMLNSK